MTLLVNNFESLKAGLQKELMSTWKQKFPEFSKSSEALIRDLPDSTLRRAPYAFKEVVPTVNPWPYGTTRQKDSFRDRLIEIDLFPYNLSISFSGWDEDDDQLGDMRTQVQTAVRRYAQLKDRLFTEYLNGTADLNPELKLAYDGAPIFSAVDGDNNPRFGRQGGNLLTGSGFTPADLKNDLSAVQRGSLEFLDPAGDILFAEEDLGYTGMHCIIPQSLNQQFQDLSNAEFLRVDSQNSVSESNWLKGTFSYQINNRLTNQRDWYVVIKHPEWKPMLYRSPKDIRSVFADIQNSDHARETNEFTFYTDIRVGMGLWAPFTIFKVANS